MLDGVNKRWPNIRHRILKPFVFKTNPNFITIAALLTAFAAGSAIMQNNLLLATFLVLLNGFLDILDGEIARKYGKSMRGDFLDHTADRIADVFIIGGVIAGGFIDTWTGIVAISLMLLVSYIGTESQALTRKRLYAGVMGRADRLVLITAGLIAEMVWPGALLIMMLILILLSAVTFCQRFFALWSALR